MLKKPAPQQTELEMVTIDSLVPADHLLRKIDAVIDFSFIHDLLDGTVLYTDSTHLKANANKNKHDKKIVTKSRFDYWDDLDRAVEQDRSARGKKPLKPKDCLPVAKESKISRTDPDSGYMVRDGKHKGFFYLDHRMVDGRLGIITDTFATPANIHDSIVYLSRLDRQNRPPVLESGSGDWPFVPYWFGLPCPACL